MEAAIRKADTLKEALPYIKDFYGKVVVVKYGGSSLGEIKARKSILEDLVFMRYVGMKPVLVHGGGLAITEALKKSDKAASFINGYRVTDIDSLHTVEKVLSGINRNFVKDLNKQGCEAFGIIGSEVGLIKAKRYRLGKEKVDLGFVGEILSVDRTVISRLLDSDIIPVVAPLGRGKDGQVYNINADSSAGAIAVALKAEKLVLLTNVRGLLKDGSQPDSVIHTASAAQVKSLIKKGVIGTGMIPKVKAGLTAIKGGVKKVHIIDAKLPHALLLEIFTDKGIGTEIVARKRRS